MPKGLKDFSQCNFDDLRAWLKMAHEEFGLYTIVRPGPFICAEWAGGAHPRWLGKFCPEKYETSFWLRSNHPDYLKWIGHWYDAVSPVFAEEQLCRKEPGEKGIIMVQLENEYVYFGMEGEKKIEVLKCLAGHCLKNGIEVPLFTCVTPEVRGSQDPLISQLFDMDNQYVWWNIHEAKMRLEDLKRQQPNAPAFVCELQGGWFSTVGGGLSEDYHLDGRHARGMALMGIAGGGTGLNYYMFFGGTHLAGWGARRMTTTYDYGAPLKESGGVGEKYAAVKGIGEFVGKYGKQLVRSKAVEFKTVVNPEKLTVAVRRATDGTWFLFFHNRDRKLPFRENVVLKTVTGEVFHAYCSLDPSDSRVLVVKNDKSQGVWWPKEQALPQRPTNMPEPIRIARVETRPEIYNAKWKKLSNGRSLPELGVNDCRYSMYRSTVKLTSQEADRFGSLVCEMFTGDPLYLEVNGKVAERASSDELDNTFVLDGLLQPGMNQFTAIYENQGHAHGYRPMEELSGMKSAGLGKKQTAILPVEDWDVKEIIGKDYDVRQLLASQEGWEKIRLNQKTIADLATLQIAGLQKPEWPAAWVLQNKTGKAVYRTTLEYTPGMITDERTLLEFGCVDDEGTLWVNGKEVATHNSWETPFRVNLARYIRSGKNEIAIVVTNNSGNGGLLKGVRLLRDLKVVKPLKWEVALDLGGVENGYCLPGLSQEGWQNISLDTTKSLKRKGNNIQPRGERNGLLTWYRVTFDLPVATPDVWIPWRAIINASGNGYIWLNGHNIGRHWEAGPQREFYLPECWLNFGGKNTLVLGLRQSEQCGALLEGVEILPYYEDAEMR